MEKNNILENCDRTKAEKIVVLIHCLDKKGIVAHVSSWFYAQGFNILHCQQYTSADEDNMFFMRVELAFDDVPMTKEKLESEFKKFADKEGFSYKIYYSSLKERVAILVSKTSHCLYELLSRYEDNDFVANIVMIIGNHDTLRSVAEKFNIPFYHMPIKDKDKVSQEKEIIKLLKKNNIDLVVLARYMQILTPTFINEYRNRIINIHHGFLPAFQGANPYRQAYERGVKIIGASAHYASEDLDQGPIIEQDVVRVNHEAGPNLLRDMGKDVEKRTLLAAVRAHIERRIIVYKNKTIVFSKEG